MTDAARQAMLLQLDGGTARRLVRAQNFTVERLGDPTGGTAFGFASASEILLLLPGTGGALSGTQAATLPGHAIAILPAGDYMLRLATAGEAYILAAGRLDDAGGAAVNAEAYATPDPRVKPVGAPFVRQVHVGAVRIHPIADIAIPPDNGRLRFLQSETMSINWVEYRGRRDRKTLSPHAHEDLEQATLAVRGDYIHHLRTPWGRNADLWRDDAHLRAGPASVAIIPPDIIHTTEGVGDELHILVDIFAPPRRDFIERGWMHNAADYLASDAV